MFTSKVLNSQQFIFQIQVCIKCLSEDRMENNPVEFLKEASIMYAVHREHIVRLYRVVLDTSAFMLV